MTDELAQRRAARRRTRARRPHPIPGLWARIALLLGLIAVAAFFAVCLVTKAVKPYREATRQTAQLAETRRRTALLAARNACLERRVAYLRTSDGVASEARRMGLLRPGEYPIVVEGLQGRPDLGESRAEADPAPAASPPGPLRRFWQHLAGR